MQDITRFRGCLKEFNLDIINQELIDFMLDNEIIYKEREFDEGEEQEYTDLDLIEFSFPITFNKRHFTLNKDIYLDIFNIIENGVKFAPSDKRITTVTYEIEKKVYAELDENKKLKILFKYRKNLFDSIDFLGDFKVFEEYLDNPTFDDNKHWSEQDVECWKCWVMDNIRFDENMLKAYFTEKSIHFEYDSQESNTILTRQYRLNKKWRTYLKTKRISDFINQEIQKLQGNKEISKSKHIIKLTDREKVLLIEAIRDIKSSIWDNLTPTDKEKLFNLLINGSERNVREYISEIDKPSSKKSKAANNSNDKIAQLLRNLGM